MMADLVRADAVAPAVLRVRGLHVQYPTRAGVVKAVNDVSFTLRAGERLGLVGESGSGKSTIAYAILRQLKSPGEIAGGEVLLDDQNLLTYSPEAMRKSRFRDLALIPQGAMNALNPVMRIGSQIMDIYDAHENELSKAQIMARVHSLLEWVGLDATVLDRYPHELSGGMKQRVCIAMGIALRPKLIIADEPTSALDVVVQRRVMETLGRVQRDLNAALILVGHDMGLMAQCVDMVGVMYAGRLVEVGDVRTLFRNPQHPYTQMLISSIPSLAVRGTFTGIPGEAPSLLNPPSGCPFHPRCPHVMEVCTKKTPALLPAEASHRKACHLYDEASSTYAMNEGKLS